MSLYVRTTGQGPDVVFLHGWGMNSEVWFEVQDALQAEYRITLIDLPGHGRSRNVQTNFSFDILLDVLAPHIPPQSVVVGWSLGGLLAQGLALQNPEKIKKLILVASNAQFQQSEDWPSAMKLEVLDGFVQSLHQNYKATLQQFLMLQALGAENAKQTIRELKHRLFLHGDPDPHALEGGLMLLKNVSLQERLVDVKMPVLMINGKLDSLVPVSAGEQMLAVLPDAELKVIEKAGHAPFLSHVELFVTYIKEFLSK